ncbi:hypothetical protein L6164_029641 [Bauhinia variegata]|uniref:Uncharacterized protein n=1 Tax=Bauhinia variegata TaxID=167791 RepID=A0ACB9LAC8_BAUVA|nr:hypothetical protein L6164_029641 [Bauhinia variegata]
MLVLWSLKLQPCPKISKPFIVALLGPALFHTIGHISACVSFSKVAVSFTHVIKSAEPVFSVISSSFLVEGSQWIPGYYKAIEVIGKPSTFYIWVLLSGVFYHLYNQSSYQALDDISPLTFSVGNTTKRVVVIVSSVIVFRNPVRLLNAIGSAIAILGTFLYSQTTAKETKKIEGQIFTIFSGISCKFFILSFLGHGGEGLWRIMLAASNFPE